MKYKFEIGCDCETPFVPLSVKNRPQAIRVECPTCKRGFIIDYDVGTERNLKADNEHLERAMGYGCVFVMVAVGLALVRWAATWTSN